MRRIKKGFPLFLTAALVLGLFASQRMMVRAAVGDTFTVDGMMFTVLTESGSTGTVQVGNGNNAAVDNMTTTLVTIPATVVNSGRTYSITRISNNAFIGCVNLTRVNIHSAVTFIGNFAFAGCEKLSAVYFDGNAPTVDSFTFYSIDPKASVYINRSATGFPAAGQLWNGMIVKYRDLSVNIGDIFTVDGITYKALSVDGIPGSTGTVQVGLGEINEPATDISVSTLSIPAIVSYSGVTFSVTRIGEYAFFQNQLTSVTIPDGVTYIDNMAFAFGALPSVTIPASVTYIGNMGFNSSNLTTVYFDGNAPSVGSSPFNGAYAYVYRDATGFPGLEQYWNGCIIRHRDEQPTVGEKFIVDGVLYQVMTGSGEVRVGDGGPAINLSITSLNIPATVKYRDFTYTVTGVAARAFQQAQFTSVTIPNTVTYVEEYAFYQCQSLTALTLPNSLTNIGDFAFSFCDKVASVTIPSTVTSVGEFAFAFWTSLTDVNILNTVIGKHMFASCDAIQSVVIPASVITIDINAFYACHGLKNVTFANGLTTIGEGMFGNCTSLESVIIPNTMMSIKEGAFVNCSSLTDITIPASVTTIGDSAFYACSGLTDITIPANVAVIGPFAFVNCANLSAVRFEGNAPNVSDNTFTLTSYTPTGAYAYISPSASGFPPEGGLWYGLTIAYQSGGGDAQDVAADKTALTWDVIRGGNTTQNAVTVNLATLPAAGANGTTITWSSLNPAISNTGAVTRPANGAGNATGTLTATITKGSISDTVVFNLTVLESPPPAIIQITKAAVTVTAPIAGNAPSASAAQDTALMGGAGAFSVSSVTWLPNDAAFQNSAVYTVTVTLTADSGYTFAVKDANAAINGKKAKIAGNGGSTLTLSYTFPETAPTVIPTAVIKKAAVTVVAPAAGNTPPTTAIQDTDLLGGVGAFTVSSVTWAPNDAAFLAGVPYTVTITLTADSGYTFNGILSANSAINKKKATIVSNNGATLTLTYTF